MQFLRKIKRFIVNLAKLPKQSLDEIKAIYDHPLSKLHPIRSTLRHLHLKILRFLTLNQWCYPIIGGVRLQTISSFRNMVLSCPHGLHEPDEMVFLMKSLSKNDFFLDVGANIGSYALPISAVTKCRSIAIEAIPSTYEALIRNIKRNKLENLVLPLNIGASAQEGKLTFTADLNVSNRVIKGNRSSIDFIEIKTNSLDNIITNPIKAMKVDVEGFETEVIEGAKKLLGSPDLEILIIEINGHGMKNFGFDEDLLQQKIQTQGFTPVHYDLDKNQLTATSGRNLHGNTIFVKNITHLNEILKNSHFKLTP